jgi:hypothetical protein
MNFQEIGRKVKTYYQKEQSHLILALASEFKSDGEKAIALAFLDFNQHQSTIKKLLKQESFTWLESKELVEIIPSITPCLPEKSHRLVLSFLMENKDLNLEEISLPELLSLYPQLTNLEQNKIKQQLSLNEALIFDANLGNFEALKEELLTHPNLQEKYDELSLIAKKINSTIPSLESLTKQWPIAQQMLNLQDLVFEKEQVLLEKEIIVKVFSNGLYRLSNKTVDYFNQLKDYVELDVIVKNFIKEIIDQDDEIRFLWLLEKNLIKSDIYEVCLNQQSWKCLNKILSHNPKVLNQVVEYFFSQSEALGLEDWFISGMEILASNHLSELSKLPIIQKIALKSSNYSQNKFYSKIWDWLQEKLAFNYFATGKHSFANHYPQFYQDICELERFNLFYSLKDFRNYIEEINLKEHQYKNYLQSIVEIIYNRVKKINQVLTSDLEKRFNHLSQKLLTNSDCAVLSAYLEKLTETEQCLTKLLNIVSKDQVYLEQLFKTGQNEATLPNLKGFHLGELKIGGLENYQGHGKQIKEILSPLGLIISPDIKKEVDHYIFIKDENKIKLDLVESKNYKKILTNQNPKMFEIKTQKHRLDNVVSQIKDQSKVSLDVNSKIILNRGLTVRSRQTLETSDYRAQSYNEAQGVLFNFDELAFVVNEETEKLCSIINKKKTFDKELFADKIVAIAHLIAMLEEDDSQPCSDLNKGASNKAKELFNICSKILSNKLNNSLYYKDVGQSIIGAYRGIVSQRESL